MITKPSLQLSSEIIRSSLRQSACAEEAGLDIVVLDEIGSTNDWALQQCKQGRVLPFVCFAEKQSSGRGRRGKQWLQSKNSNIAMSLALPCRYEREAIAHLALAVALSVVYALEEMGVKDCQVKWPNDVLVAGEKIAGILIETVPLPKDKADESDAASWAAIIGIGFNYDMSAMHNNDDLMAVAWTDLMSVLNMANAAEVAATDESTDESMGLKKPVLQREGVAAILLKSCLKTCLSYPDNISRLRASFEKQYDYCRGKQVALLLDDGEKLQGVATGLSDKAELIVQIEGVVRVFHSADVSVRPLVEKSVAS